MYKPIDPALHAAAVAAAMAGSDKKSKAKDGAKKPGPKKGKRGKRKGPPEPTLVVNLGPNDVLMGRGSLFADYDGNVRLRKVRNRRLCRERSCAAPWRPPGHY